VCSGGEVGWKLKTPTSIFFGGGMCIHRGLPYIIACYVRIYVHVFTNIWRRSLKGQSRTSFSYSSLKNKLRLVDTYLSYPRASRTGTLCSTCLDETPNSLGKRYDFISNCPGLSGGGSPGHQDRVKGCVEQREHKEMFTSRKTQVMILTILCIFPFLIPTTSSCRSP